MASLDQSLVPESLRNRVISENLVVGQTLFLEQDAAESIYFLEFGEIKLLHNTESGQLIQHYRIKAGEIFAEFALFNDNYLCTAIAEIPSRVVIFPKRPFLEALQQDVYLSTRMMEQMARRLHQVKTLITTRSIRSARDRVLHYLQIAVQPEQNTLNLELPLKEIAEEIGISPEAFSRALKGLQREGIITRRKRRIIFSHR
jgi:CRP-like cAMP-binding protein